MLSFFTYEQRGYTKYESLQQRGYIWGYDKEGMPNLWDTRDGMLNRDRQIRKRGCMTMALQCATSYIQITHRWQQEISNARCIAGCRGDAVAKPEMQWFYKSGAWKSVRLQALKRDHFSCQLCKQRATEVHHLIELNTENVNDKNISLNLTNLQSLCHDCHSRLTRAEHGLQNFDCDDEFYFDENGLLLPRGS